MKPDFLFFFFPQAHMVGSSLLSGRMAKKADSGGLGVRVVFFRKPRGVSEVERCSGRKKGLVCVLSQQREEFEGNNPTFLYLGNRRGSRGFSCHPISIFPPQNLSRNKTKRGFFGMVWWSQRENLSSAPNGFCLQVIF